MGEAMKLSHMIFSSYSKTHEIKSKHKPFGRDSRFHPITLPSVADLEPFLFERQIWARERCVWILPRVFKSSSSSISGVTNYTD